jgi:hypothetical protein
LPCVVGGAACGVQGDPTAGSGRLCCAQGSELNFCFAAHGGHHVWHVTGTVEGMPGSRQPPRIPETSGHLPSRERSATCQRVAGRYSALLFGYAACRHGPGAEATVHCMKLGVDLLWQHRDHAAHRRHFLDCRQVPACRKLANEQVLGRPGIPGETNTASASQEQTFLGRSFYFMMLVSGMRSRYNLNPPSNGQHNPQRPFRHGQQMFKTNLSQSC